MDFPIDKQAWLTGFDIIHKNTAVENLDIQLVDIDNDHIELTMPISDKARQPYGLLHGGITMALAETAASVHACYGRDLSIAMPVGIEINGSHVRSAKEGTVRAIGKVVRRTKALIVHQIDVYHLESGELLSTARVTNYYKSVNQGEG